MDLVIGHCYKNVHTGEILKLVNVCKRYGRSKQGKLSPNVMTAYFDNVLEHGGRVLHQVRYMAQADWVHLGDLRNVHDGRGSVDVFILNGAQTPLSEVA